MWLSGSQPSCTASRELGDASSQAERSAREVTHVKGAQLAPDGAHVWNPAFDVTPHQLIAGIITERGIFRAPYTESLKRAFETLQDGGMAGLQEVKG